MPRVKNGVAHHARKKKIMEAAKGGFQARSKLYKAAKETVEIITGEGGKATAFTADVFASTAFPVVDPCLCANHRYPPVATANAATTTPAAISGSLGLRRSLASGGIPAVSRVRSKPSSRALW